MAICLFRMTFRYIIKLSVPIKRATVILIKVISCNSLLCMLQACISICLRSGLRYKFLILDTYHRAHYLREQWCEDPLLFFYTKRGPRAKKVLETLPWWITSVLSVPITRGLIKPVSRTHEVSRHTVK